MNRVISTKNIATDRVTDTSSRLRGERDERWICRYEKLPAKSELADLIAKLTTPVPVTGPDQPPVKTLEQIRQEIVTRITPAVTKASPEEVPL